MARVDTFLDRLNRTVLGELREVRTQYDQIWQSTVIALETQRDQSEREIVALGERLGLLADEVVFQKRMAIAQSALLLVCLVLVIFSSRGGAGAGVAGSGFSLESYYPTQLLPSSRLASPVYPSTPKAPASPEKDLGREQGRATKDSGLLSVVDEPPTPTSISLSPSPPGSAYYSRFPDGWPRPRYRQSPSQTLLEIARRQAVPSRGRSSGVARGWGNHNYNPNHHHHHHDDNNNNNDTHNHNHNHHHHRHRPNDENSRGATTPTIITTAPRRPSPPRASSEPLALDYFEQQQQQQKQQQHRQQENRDQDRNRDGQPRTPPSRLDLSISLDLEETEEGYDSEPAMRPHGTDYFPTTPTAKTTGAGADRDGGNNHRDGDRHRAGNRHSGDDYDRSDGDGDDDEDDYEDAPRSLHSSSSTAELAPRAQQQPEVSPSSAPTPTALAPPPSSSPYVEALARKAERQLTPSASEGEADYLPSRSARPPLSHAGSTRAPLPALPEDSD